jgi:hypothetical protein
VRPIHLANETGQVSAEDLHRTLMVLLQSNFAAVTTTTGWVDAVAGGRSLVRSNLVVPAMSGAEAFTGCSWSAGSCACEWPVRGLTSRAGRRAPSCT